MGFKNMFKQFIKSKKGETEKGKQKEQTEKKNDRIKSEHTNKYIKCK